MMSDLAVSFFVENSSKFLFNSCCTPSTALLCFVKHLLSCKSEGTSGFYAETTSGFSHS